MRRAHLYARQGNCSPDPDYLPKMKKLLSEYMRDLNDSMKELKEKFTGKTEEQFSEEEMMAYLAWKLLEKDPSKRLSAKEGDELLSRFRQRTPA